MDARPRATHAKTTVSANTRTAPKQRMRGIFSSIAGQIYPHDVAEVQIVDGEVGDDGRAQVAQGEEESTEQEPDQERRQRPGQVAEPGAEVQEGEDQGRPPDAEPGEQSAAKKQLFSDGA